MNRYMITQLLNPKDKKAVNYLKKYTFHIIPIMNPDGFVITQTSNRMHRKNAQPNGRCLGTDSKSSSSQLSTVFAFLLSSIEQND